jgi:hypothetical protein
MNIDLNVEHVFNNYFMIKFSKSKYLDMISHSSHI